MQTLKQRLDVNMTHIESRPSKIKPGLEYEFYVECSGNNEQKLKLVSELKELSTNVSVLSRDPSENEGKNGRFVSSLFLHTRLFLF